ncbi:MAG: threonine--tRNA ligase [Candidatus Magasanikbacteria bacterium CG10_big_fil_rev_8_21_14_0_10_43_6]|uniref:Threonine--tRNA ligase n=1 Tax=Candidatus Magasanikbacteria bacterium CG10_big_fil_rev_8_21_14_0_10_43_6 TaxID=1974650 RepID=A0A2M6W074_9BACT|nr:MAG: threonine--tRNA ligase [Candidatus Magasanikbacteria bacterium CG10_big_fil_rev_8_21_14_0_10_43_6]
MDSQQLQDLRHSCAHLLAAAVMSLWPDAKRTIGPAIDSGFYFDFDFGETKVSEADFPKIEKRMKKILQSWEGFERHELTAEEAKAEYPGNIYKHELINEFTADGSLVSFYKSGQYWDLCRGGHCEAPRQALKHFKLLSLAGAYWRGDEKNPMLTRIYGTCFPTGEALDAHLTMLEEAKKRDHRKLGKELDLFTFSDLVGPGLPLWTPRGTQLRHILDEFVWELRQACGYDRVEIPHITKKELYETSGHWAKFRDELFRITTREGHEFAMKPMNCPHHTQIYARKKWSYRELPQRYANTTTCYRDEQTGELHGLSRVRAFTQDDAHVFCRQGQVQAEFLKIWDIIDTFYKAVGFGELSVRLSLHDPDNFEAYLGTPDMWQSAETALREIATSRGVSYVEDLGEAAFYGPKVDFMTRDSIGREWQVATIQLDMNMPERFDLSCTNETGEDERVVMIHAAIMGSIERFFSIFVEHHAGNFPVWLSPVQVQILPVSTEKHLEGAHTMAATFAAAGIRVAVDDADETVGKKIRNAATMKIPYILVVGDKELGSSADSGQGEDLMIRVRGQEEQESMSTADFIARVQQEVADKK